MTYYCFGGFIINKFLEIITIALFKVFNVIYITYKLIIFYYLKLNDCF